MTLSIIIPVTRPEPELARLLESVPAGYEIIVVGVNAFKQAKRHHIYIQSDAPHRAALMNLGAHVAKGDILLFLHPDTTLPDATLHQIEHLDQCMIGGGADITFDPNTPLLSLIAWGSNNIRMRRGKIIYGDQCIFVRRTIFNNLGGYKDLALFEDYDFSSRLRQKGRLLFLKGAVTSSRRFIANGILRQTLRNWYLTMLYWCGVPDTRLRKLYGT